MLLGKPSVAWRKVVNTMDDSGASVGVNAQQYVVLVMDVPNLTRQRDTCAGLTSTALCTSCAGPGNRGCVMHDIVRGGRSFCCRTMKPCCVCTELCAPSKLWEMC